MTRGHTTPETLYAVALGCPKNRVDVEAIVALAAERGMRLVDDPSRATALLVATCGFVTDASEESIETVFELSGLRPPGSRLVVAGCLAQRYGEDLAESMPEADAFVGTGDLSAVVDALLGQGAGRVVVGPAGSDLSRPLPRRPSLHPGSAYLKVADGCSRSCAFCTIPSIRGPFRSRPIDELCDEVRDLTRAGAVEVNLVAQDLTAYGRDRPDAGEDLAALLRSVARVDGVRWVRPMYLYPERGFEAVLEVMATEERVVPYLDMPVQHGSDPILRRMKRGATAALTRSIISKARAAVPDLWLRTTVIVGHPGEGQGELDELLELIRWARFDHLGAFRYSQEEGTASASQDAPVSRRDSYNRYRKVMAIQRRISRARCKAMVGATVEVLVQGPSEDSPLVYVGRHPGQAPEVDGLVYLDQPVAPGSMVEVAITRSADYDLFGEVQIS